MKPLSPEANVKFGFFEALKEAAIREYLMIKMIFSVLHELFAMSVEIMVGNVPTEREVAEVVNSIQDPDQRTIAQLFIQTDITDREAIEFRSRSFAKIIYDDMKLNPDPYN